MAFIPFIPSIVAFLYQYYDNHPVDAPIRDAKTPVELEIQKVYEKYHTGKQLKFQPNSKICLACKSFPNYDVILYDPESELVKLLRLGFNHEVGHLVNNHIFRRSKIASINSLIMGIVGTKYFSISKAFDSSFFRTITLLAITSATAYISWEVLDRMDERQADDFGMKNSSEDDLKISLVVWKLISQSEAKENAKRSLYTKFINFITDPHPIGISRANKIEKYLMEKGVSLEDLETQTKSIRKILIEKENSKRERDKI